MPRTHGFDFRSQRHERGLPRRLPRLPGAHAAATMTLIEAEAYEDRTAAL